MNLYLIERTDHADWDETRGMVVAASYETDAVAVWYADNGVRERFEFRVILLGTAAGGVKAGMILRDYKAG